MDAATFATHPTRRFGTTNPTRMDLAFWHHMVRTGEDAYAARQQFDPNGTVGEPVWCFNRFGPTRTRLPDGRVVCVGGEHEDHYDPDFCIYNDVVVAHPDGRAEIFGYPPDVFPPTDFHTATLCGDRVVILGGLGYADERGGPDTPAFALDPRTFAVERLPTTGPSPGWVFGHRAEVAGGGGTLRVSGGELVRGRGKDQTFGPYEGAADLDLSAMTWRPAPPPPAAGPRPRPEWPDPWDAVGTGQAIYLVNSLRDEVPLGHPLFAADVEPLAEDDAGRVLFLVLDGTGRAAVVALGFTDRHATLPEPRTTFYPSVDDWLRATGTAAG